jgi:tRNA threonylcarbamoyl adenosine modification protein YeaZ
MTRAASPGKTEATSPLLVVDTSAAGVALGLERGGRLARVSLGRSTRHDEAVWRLLDRLLKKCGAELSDIGAVAAARGPGRFTGVRVGLTVATMLSQSLGIPAVGVSLLDSLADTCGKELRPGERLLALTPAIRDEVYYQVFPDGGPGWTKLAGLAGATGQGPLAIAGEPAESAAAALSGARILRSSGPTLAELAALARRRLAEGDGAASLSPLYLKPATFQGGKH